MAIETWQDAIGTLATVKGYPDIVLRIKQIQADLMANVFTECDLRPGCGMPAPIAACMRSRFRLPACGLGNMYTVRSLLET